MHEEPRRHVQPLSDGLDEDETFAPFDYPGPGRETALLLTHDRGE